MRLKHLTFADERLDGELLGALRHLMVI
jgi:hypothetical protein